jgi:hypothetical protein
VRQVSSWQTAHSGGAFGIPSTRPAVAVIVELSRAAFIICDAAWKIALCTAANF